MKVNTGKKKKTASPSECELRLEHAQLGAVDPVDFWTSKAGSSTDREICDRWAARCIANPLNCTEWEIRAGTNFCCQKPFAHEFGLSCPTSSNDDCPEKLFGADEECKGGFSFEDAYNAAVSGVEAVGRAYVGDYSGAASGLWNDYQDQTSDYDSNEYD